MKPLVAAFALTVSLAVAGSADAAGPIELKFGFPNPPTAWINTLGIGTWAKNIALASADTVAVKVFAGGSVVNQRNVYDRVLNGVVDFGYGPFGEISDQMPRTEVTALPFEADDMVQASKALWRLLQAGTFDKDFARVRPITAFCLPPSGLHTVAKEVRTLDDLKGMKIISATRLNGEVVERLGATVVSITNPQSYAALNRGVAAGTMLSDAGLVVFKIEEVTKYHLNLPLGCSAGGFFMNPRSYARLPAKAQHAIDAASGTPMANFMAEEAHAQDLKAHAIIAKRPGSVMVALAPAEAKRWRARLAPIAEEWAKATPDGTKVLAAYRAEIKKMRGGS